MNTKKITKTVAVLALLLSMTAATLSLGASRAYADPYQPTTPSKDILIDKMVGKPVSDKGTVTYDYVDNLTAQDHTFKPGDVVYFRLRVKNTSQATLTDVVVKDFEPSYFTLSNDPGTVSSETLSINAGNFEPGEEKVYIIQGRIDNTESTPTGTTCVTNKARAEDDGIVDEDTAQFCFNETSTSTTKGTTTTVTVPTEVPSTGAEDGLLIVASAFGLAVLGFRLYRTA